MNGSTTYVLAVLPKAGLCNKLFPWARAVVFAEERGAILLEPRWWQAALGPSARGESDRRLYFDLFQDDLSALRGWRRALILGTTLGGRIPERAAWRNDAKLAGRLVVFQGPANHFAPIAARSAVVRRRLWAITRQKWQGAVRELGTCDIAIHVRCGDCAEENRHPISWYVGALRGLRRRRPRLRARVFSDGTNSELAELLEEPWTERCSTGSAIGDLWALSQGRVLIGSGFSTFTMWATFLGQRATVLREGYYYYRVDPQRPRLVWEWEEGAGERILEDLAEGIGAEESMRPWE